jgi:UDP-N-acetylmuramoyl-L-alanyl-D-glutamate--2,6-diaminopimelate ligase
MKLETLATSATADLIQLPRRPVEITGITCDSRQVRCGDLFAALPGVKADGSAFARQAASRGAVAILAERADPLTELPQLCCQNARLSLAHVARAFYGHADLRMKLGAVTGTNGKTTTAYLVRHLLRRAGWHCGMIGTIEYDLGAGSVEAPLTTPESVELHRYLRAMADAGCQATFMETSSHALHQNRVAGLNFSVAVFTNLTQDHLDYHRTMEAYRDAKALLFRGLSADAVAVLNMDDPAGASYSRETKARVLGFSLKDTADIRATVCKMDIQGTVFQLATPWGSRRVSWRLAGAHNVQNAMGALAAAVSLGADFDRAAEALEDFAGVPGRLEAVDGGLYGAPLPFRVLVDYAHTDDALLRVMRRCAR